EVSVLGERAAMVPSAGILLITDILFVAGQSSAHRSHNAPRFQRGRNASDDSGRNMMKRLSTLATTTVLLLFLGLGLPAGEAMGQAKGKISKEQLVGAWANVSVQVERADGNKVETFGPNLKGVFI